MTDISGLLERVRTNRKADNALDVEIEIAVFQHDALYAGIRANAAGTKVIYTSQDGHDHTCWAWDWTLNDINQNQAIIALSALSSGDAS